MAGLLGWFNDAVHNVENGIGGFVNGAASTVNDGVHNVQRAVAPLVPQQPQQQAPRPQPAPRPPVQHSVLQDVLNMTKPIGQGGINGLANIGQFVEGIPSAIGNDFSTAYKQAAIGTANNTGVAPAAVANQNQYLQNMVKQGKLSQQEANSRMAANSKLANQNQQAVHTAEQQQGVKQDQSAGALALVNAASDVAGAKPLVEGAIKMAAPSVIKGSTAVANGVRQFDQAAARVGAPKDMPINPEAGFAKIPGGNKPIDGTNQGMKSGAKSVRTDSTLPSANSGTPVSAPKTTAPPPQSLQQSPAASLKSPTNTGAKIDGTLSSVPSIPPEVKQRGLTSGMKSSNEFTKPLQKAVDSSYATFTNNAANMATDQFMKQPLNDAHAQVLQTLSQGGGNHVPGAVGNLGVTFGKQEVANAGAVMKALDQAGRIEDAQQIHDLLAQKLTNAGQTSQAAQLVYSRSAAGLKNMAYRTLSNSGVPMTPELSTKLDTVLNQVKNTTDGTRANNLARAQYHQLVAQQIPTGAGTKALSLYKTGILSSPKTAVKIAVANPLQALAENVSDTVAAPVDRLVSKFTGKRAVVAPNPTNLKAYGQTFAGQGLQDAKQKLVHNITMPGSTGMGMSELSGTAAHADGANFGVAKNGGRTKLDKLTNGVSSKALNMYTSSIGRVHGSIQTPFYEARTAQSLMQSGQAEAATLGLKGADKVKFLQAYVKNPPKEALQIAQDAAGHATNQMKTSLGSAASGLQRTLPGGQFIAPITRVPGAVATQVVNYSPLGFAKTIGQAVMDKSKGLPFNQAEFSRGIGRGVVGSGLLAGGAALYSQGRMSGDYPSGDKATQTLWKSANIPANSVYVGGTAYPNEPWKNKGGVWLQIGSPGGAAAQSALTGASVVEGAKQGGIPGAVLGGVSGGAKIVTNQPYLTGVSGAMNVVTNPTQGKSFLDQSTGSVVPNFIRDFASSTDPLQRQTSVGSIPQSMLNSVTNGIPGLRELNQPQMDVFGNPLQRNNDPLNAALNPFNPQVSHPTDLTTALGTIHNTQDVNGKPLPIPTADANNIQLKDPGGVKFALNDAQRTQYVQQSGQAAQAALNSLIQTDNFKNATPDQQSKMVAKIVSGNRDVASKDFGNTAKLSADGKMVASGNTPSANADGKVTTGSSKTDLYKSNGAEYQKLLADYNQKVKDGTYTQAQQIKAQDALNKAKVGADFSKNTRDLYGLSKAQLANLVTTDPNGKAILDQVLQYGDALVNSGIASYNKFRNSKTGAVSLANSKGGRKGSGGGRRSSGGRKGSGAAGFALASSARSNAYKIKTPKISSAPTFKAKTAKAFKAPSIKQLASASFKTPNVPVKKHSQVA